MENPASWNLLTASVAACDLDDTVSYKTTLFDFARHRQPDQYRALTDEA